MKKTLFLTTIFILSTIFCSAKRILFFHIPQDSIYSISKIVYTIGIPPFGVFDDLKINESYKIIIDSNGIVELTWINKCPNKDLMVCSYFGKITTNEFKKIKVFIIESGFMNLNKNYKDEFSESSQSFNITFNKNIVKEVEDSTFEIVIFNNLKQMILDLKKYIKWVPNNL